MKFKFVRELVRNRCQNVFLPKVSFAICQLRIEAKRVDQNKTIGGVADTALWVAIYRARESERPDALFNDPFAAILAGERGKEIADRMSNAAIMQWILSVRTVGIDRLIEKAIAEGCDTVLNLGAGLDTRPYRMKLSSSLSWIEIDFPEIIELKNEKLRLQQSQCVLERIALDLGDRAVRQRVFTKINANAKKVLVITEGVVAYLANTAVAELAEDLATQNHFQYWIQDFRDGGFKKNMPKGWAKKLKSSPFKFEVENTIDFFAKHCWEKEEVIYAIDEGQRLGRKFPFPFPWHYILKIFVPSAVRKKMKHFGYVMFKNSKTIL